MRKINTDSIEKIPPHDLSAEQAVLGGLLVDGKFIDEVRPILPDPNMFYSEAHRFAYRKMLQMNDEGLPIDPVILGGLLDSEVVSMGYLAELAEGVPTTRNIGLWAEKVRELHYRREMLVASQKVQDGMYDSKEFAGIMSEAKTLVDKVVDKALTVTGALAGKKEGELKETVEDTYGKIESMQQAELDFPTGIRSFDYRTGGFWNSDLIVVGGATSCGKTAFALTGCSHLLPPPKKKRVMYFSLEMGRQGLVQRMMQMDTEVNLGHGHIRFLEEAELEKLYDFKREVIPDWNFIIFDDLETNMDIERWVRVLRPDILFIDHLQLVVVSGNRENRTRELTEFTRSLKRMAGKYDMPVVVLSQLRKDAEGRVPLVSDLYESGGIGQNADQVFLLYRPGMYNKKKYSLNETKLYIAKNRHGEVGQMKLYFNTKKLRFYDMEGNYENS